MKTIPTAVAFLIDNASNPNKGWSEKKRLIEFAKLHVEACKQEVAEKAYEAGKLDKELNLVFDNPKGRFMSTINAYPLTNIK